MTYRVIYRIGQAQEVEVELCERVPRGVFPHLAKLLRESGQDGYAQRCEFGGGGCQHNVMMHKPH